MPKQLIPKITSSMLRDFPDQVVKVINDLVDRVNEIDK